MTICESTYEKLLAQHYYSEGGGLSWAVKAYFEGLSDVDPVEFLPFSGQRLRERRTVLDPTYYADRLRQMFRVKEAWVNPRAEERIVCLEERVR